MNYNYILDMLKRYSKEIRKYILKQLCLVVIVVYNLDFFVSKVVVEYYILRKIFDDYVKK